MRVRTPAVVAALTLVLAGCADARATGPGVAAPAFPIPALVAADVPTAPGPAPGDTELDLSAADIPTLQAAMAGGRTTAAALAAAYSDRIRELDPRFRAVIGLDPTAAAQAAASDRRRATGAAPRPLEGIPVLVKDNISTGPDQPTTAGSLALAQSRPPQSEVARRLRDAGAVLLGKTNLSEWASYRSSQSASGWSPVGGLTRNPYAPDRSACGSSSGSAAAVAASFAPVAIGTETAGSIVCPSATNALVGVKPGVGLVGRTGIVPLSAAQDTAGPMARSVRDATLVLSVLQGTDAADPSTAEADRHRVAAQAPGRPLAGARIGVLRQFTGDSGESDAVFEATLARLRDQGATLVDPVSLPSADQAGEAASRALSTEFARDIDAYLRSPGVSGPRSLAELVEFDRRNAAAEMPFWGQELFESALATGGDTADPAYRDARAAATGGSRRDIDAALNGQRLDALIAPTNGPAWVNDLVNGDHLQVASAGPAAAAGYPSVTVPAGTVPDGNGAVLPIGVSLIGGQWSEERLLGLAAAVENGLPARAPAPLPSLRIPLR